ncbi:MAG: hypothetical protein ACT4P0_10335 [Panacagrimonas sp.]
MAQALAARAKTLAQAMRERLRAKTLKSADDQERATERLIRVYPEL